MKHYKDSWTDMSPWLVHFTEETKQSSSYLQMMGILSSGEVLPGRFGILRGDAPMGSQPEVACFSEIPPGNWKRLSERRDSVHGIGFTKEFIIRNGGSPIWYVWENTPTHALIQGLFRECKDKADSPFWPLTSMIEFVKPSKQFDWEREWRVPSGLRFRPEDVAFLFIPESLHEAARGFFEDAEVEHTGPAYRCPFIDSTWTREETEQSIRARNGEYPDFDLDSWLMER